ncbi:hypothetical protein [Caldanaerobacter subterraneus]|uniref:Uncharacterized protein n=1 Tax=Caldanaerobacter subterraneus TaxID=911092 RepID=A0A7Y2L8L3_9THEO|nr:hypothetical protein [Caldanaerobacter subterraneus]NNG67305.1 hypothetical protein [Caldanaerobacter subterraneus]
MKGYKKFLTAISVAVLIATTTIFMFKTSLKEQNTIIPEKTEILSQSEVKFLVPQEDREKEEIELMKKEIREKNKRLKVNEKIAEAEKMLDDGQRERVEEILKKLGNDRVEEIIKLVEKGIDGKGNEKILAILRERLTPEEIKYILELVDKYFAVK